VFHLGKEKADKSEDLKALETQIMNAKIFRIYKSMDKDTRPKQSY